MQDRRNIISDPDRLLNALKEHLTEAGGVHQNSISELIKLMSDTNGKLVPKCISLCIISASERGVQAQICEDGAWDILLKWLQEALKEDNHSFLIELMSVYLNLPVSLEQLKQNVCPKLINTLSKKSGNKEVRGLATDIVKKWKDVISRDRRNDTNSTLEPPIKKKKVPVIEKKEAAENEIDSLAKDVKKRRSTVKMPATVMRTAGIENEGEHFIPKSRSEVLSKKSKQDSNEKETTGLPIEAFHQKITVTPTEPKKSPHEVFESSSFINALATTQPIVRKKRKLPKVGPSGPMTAISDAVEMKDMTDAAVEEPVIATTPSDTEVPKKSSLANFSAFAVDKKLRKKVSWAPEDKLQEISFFEVDITERVNVTRMSCADLRQREINLEREMFERHAEIEIKDAKWRTPAPLEVTFLVEPGSKSVERQIQLERERYVLQTIYFTRDTVPVTPEEPENEEFEAKLAIEIPLEDLHAKELISENEDLLIMNDKGDGKAQMSLNPEVADLVKSLAFNYNSNVDLKSSLPSAQSPTVTSPVVVLSAGMPISTPGVVSPNSISDKLDQSHLEPSNSLTNVSNRECLSGNQQMPPNNDHQSNMAAPSFMPDMVLPANGQLPPNIRCPPPGPHGPPMPSDMRGAFPPSHRPHFPMDLRPMGPPPNFGVRHNGPPPPFRGQPPPRMFPGDRPPPNMLKANGRGHGVGQVCKFFQQGHCRHGNNCNFLHPGYPPHSGWG